MHGLLFYKQCTHVLHLQGYFSLNKQGKHDSDQWMYIVTVSSDSWAKLNSRSSSLSIAFAASVRQLCQTQESSASAVPMVRSAHGKCHQVLQVSQQILFSFSELLISSSSKITLLHFGQSKMSLKPNSYGSTNDL